MNYKLSRFSFQILGNGRVAFDFKSIGKMIPTFVTVGMDIDANGILYISDYANQILCAVDPW